MSAVTQWFPPNVKPMHVGVYETWFISPEDGGYTTWDGRKWLSEWWNIDGAARSSVPGNQKKHWRGLVVKP